MSFFNFDSPNIISHEKEKVKTQSKDIGAAILDSVIKFVLFQSPMSHSSF